jgi:hypothetical protein
LNQQPAVDALLIIYELRRNGSRIGDEGTVERIESMKGMCGGAGTIARVIESVFCDISRQITGHREGWVVVRVSSERVMD